MARSRATEGDCGASAAPDHDKNWPRVREPTSQTVRRAVNSTRRISPTVSGDLLTSFGAVPARRQEPRRSVSRCRTWATARQHSLLVCSAGNGQPSRCTLASVLRDCVLPIRRSRGQSLRTRKRTALCTRDEPPRQPSQAHARRRLEPCPKGSRPQPGEGRLFDQDPGAHSA
jgi:hypothetical protein